MAEGKMNKRKLNIFMPLLFSIVLILGMFLGYKLHNQHGSVNKLFFNGAPANALQQIMNLVDAKYVDSVNDKRIKQDAIAGIIHHLDPHSLYIPPTDLASVNEDLEGNFHGVGVEFTIYNDTVNITSVIDNSPAEKAGLLTGDKIIRVNDSLIAGNHVTTDIIKHLLRGPMDSKVKVTVLRTNQLTSLNVKRGIIPLYSVDASYILKPGIGYIRLNKFSATTFNEFMDAMHQLKKQGMKKLVLDLRQNPGGYLDAATNIADEFLDDNKMIVYTKGNHYPKKEYFAKDPGVFEKGGLAILVDEGSASASEILTGAIQDWDRGTIIGRRTFGKGLVQEQYPLSDGGALRLTIARYYIPSGRCIQKPYSKGLEAYNEDFEQRYHHGELFSKDSIVHQDTTKYHTLVKHRIVYGGGGITPDIFIPLDSDRLSDVIISLYHNNALFDFTYNYYSAHEPLLNQFKSAEDFNNNYELSDSLFNRFKSYSAHAGIGLNNISVKEKSDLKEEIKALLAKEKWHEKGYYIVKNSTDPAVTKAEEVLKDKSEEPSQSYR